MPDPFRKVLPGEDLAISAQAWNSMLDVAQYFKRNGPWGSVTKTPPPLGPVERGVVVPVQNDSGSDVERHGILRVTGFLYSPDDNEQHFLNRPCLKCDTPDDSDDQVFVVMQEPIKAAEAGNKQIRNGLILGITPVLLDVQDEADKFAAPIDGSTAMMETGASGVPIVWKESGTGVCHGYVLLGGGGGGACADRNEIQQITIIGQPTGGTLDITITINGTPDTVTVNWDDSAAEIETALEGHSEIGSGNVNVTGSGFPNATMTIEFIGDLAATEIPIMQLNWGSLTGGSGVAAIPSVDQQGHPN